MKKLLPLSFLAITLLGCSKAEEPAVAATPAASSSATTAATAPAPASAAPAPTPAADPQMGGTATKPGEAGPP